ncbi:hypothetical protein HYH02_003356 [Chlamydomonas schloesseri]|uniref:ADP,ATP carrier protein n=1 Tax=Chlamydomonas schloesseri TaxID=2026947 RepID=A0A836BA43_9CHLO|nr:hypothetical protein HYH02_003356 [Chlamydomonas schloesseri]|eukprot:KAG2452332.1 hypothetical protein HYH02_003356 [Chlamydomonas schloesseri]
MFFCILFNYTTLRNTKDVLVVTAPGAGAEVLPFLKTLDLPMAILFTMAYTAMANRLTSDMLFYACLLPFIAFFGVFGFFVYPNKEVLHPTEFCNRLAETLGPRFHAPLALLRTWTFSAFYLVAEMWGSIVVSLLFWGLANSVMTVDEAATFYPLFGMGANLSLIVAGGVTGYLSQLRASLPPGVDGWGVALQGLMGLVVVNGVLISVLHWGMQKWVVPKVQAQRAALAAAGKGGAPKAKKPKAKMSMMESFKFLASSPYIRDMATMVVSFGVALQLVEVTWKAKLKTAYPDPSDYSAFMGKFSEVVGVVTLVMMLLGRFVIKKFGWGVAALATPTVILGTAVIFLALVMTGNVFAGPLAAMGTTPLMAAVVVGSLQNVFSRASKYSLFDPCKEMAYIPLDDEIKSKGKAAVDVVGNLLGKSGGAVLQQTAIFTFGSLAASTPYLGIGLAVTILNWIRAVISLEKQFYALRDHQEAARQQQQQQQQQGAADHVAGERGSSGSGEGGSGAALKPNPA